MSDRIFLDAGILIGALLIGDPRGAEALPLVEAARRGDYPACTSVGVLSEVYGALTWSKAIMPQTPHDAAQAVALLVAPPSALTVFSDGLEIALISLRLAASHHLTARRIHDARHAATALYHGVTQVHTYDPSDWKAFSGEGIVIAGPPSVLSGAP